VINQLNTSFSSYASVSSCFPRDIGGNLWRLLHAGTTKLAPDKTYESRASYKQFTLCRLTFLKQVSGAQYASLSIFCKKTGQEDGFIRNPSQNNK